MLIREFKESDIIQLKVIHERFYKDEFSLEDFCKQYINFFVIEDNETIISAGGIRTIAESVIITNKDISVRKRREALYMMLQANMFSCNKSGYNQLHAFIQDKIWQEHLVDIGFKPCKGNALVLGV